MQEPIPNKLDLGHIASLRLTASNSALIGSGLLWIGLSALAVIFLRMAIIEAVALGLFAVLLHWIGDIAHQLGHARAARASGHPMIGIRLWGLLSSSIYPADEPPLPAQVHIRRALGGPILSLVLALISGALVLLLPTASFFWWLALFFAADNLLVFTIGSLLPLGFTDGSTILRWLRKPS
ncbi:MAG: hypothetical protein WCD37_04085 [Chloroflexia bacterium]